MFKFGTRSRRRLGTVDKSLQLLMNVAIRRGIFDLSVLEGLRTKERQQFLVATGASKTLNSKHLTGHAVDIGIWKAGRVDYKDKKAYYVLAGQIYLLAAELGIKARWGGNWDSDQDMNDQSFNDLVHWELVD